MQKSQATREWAKGNWGIHQRRQNAGLMLNYSLINTPGGTLRACLTIPSSCTVCFYMTPGRDGRRQERFICWGHWQSLPRPDPEWKLISHTTGGLLDFLERNLGPVPWGLPTKDIAWPATMWAPAKGRSYSGHLVLTDEPFAEVGGTHPAGTRTKAVWPPPPTGHSANWKLSPGPMREEANMMRPSGRPGKLTSGH